MQDDLVIIPGRLGGDPEMRYMPDGNAVTNFSLAVSRYGGKNEAGEYQNHTIWYRIAVWGRQAEACNSYLQKGQSVTVYGSLAVDKETGGPKLFTRNDGSVGASFEVNADKVIFGAKVEGGNGSNENSPAPERPAPAAKQEPASVDDIPF